MRTKSVLLTILVVALFAAMLQQPAGALIEVKFTVPKAIDSSSIVVIGKVVSVESNVVNVNLDSALKGKAPGEKIRVQIAAPADLIKQVTPGAPLVFLLVDSSGDGVAGIHLADQWLQANGIKGGNMLAWRVIGINDTLKQSFPGRTGALARLVTDICKGKSTYPDKWDRKPFAGGIRKRAKLDVQKPTWLLAEDLNGDKKPDMVVGTPAGTKLVLADGEAFKDVTAQSAVGNAGEYHAAADADGDGKTDLLLDDTLWLNQGGKFATSKVKFELPKGTPLAAALMDVNGDSKVDALLVSSSGELRIFENSGVADKPWIARPAQTLWTEGEAPAHAAFGDWGDTGKPCVMVTGKSGMVRYAIDADGGAPANLMRLTGVDTSKNAKLKGGLNNIVAVGLHSEKAGQMDYVALFDGGAVLLVNRGLGTYFLGELSADLFKSKPDAPLTLTPATPCARVDAKGKGIDDVWALGEDGTLYEIENSPK